MPQVKVNIDIGALDKAIKDALELTGKAVIDDILEAQVVPKAKGTLEGTLQPLDVADLNQYIVKIHSNTDYARRLYFHPEYNFHREPWEGGEGNPNAQAEWFEPWAGGARTPFVRDTFAYYLKNRNK